MRGSSLKSVLITLVFINLIDMARLIEESCDAEDPCSSPNDTLTASESWLLGKFGYEKHAFTSDSDYELRSALDVADELINTEPLLAVKSFDLILESSPNSPRANYARIRAMQLALDMSKENTSLDFDAQKVADYFHTFIINNEEAKGPKALTQAALVNGIAHCSTHKLDASKIRLIRSVFKMNKEIGLDSRLHLLLISTLLSQSPLDALQALDEALERLQSNLFIFKLIKGVVLKTLFEERKGEGRNLLRNLDDVDNENERIALANDINDLATEIRDANNDVNESDRTNFVTALYSEASKLHLFLSRDQRPLDVVKDLSQKPIWTNDERVSDEINLLNTNLDTMKREVGNALDDKKLWHNLTSTLLYSGQWQRLRLFSFGRRHFSVCGSHMHATCTMLKSMNVSNKGNVRIEHVWAQTTSKAIAGPTNARLRVVLALKGALTLRVGSKAKLMKVDEDNVVVFDDSFEHQWTNVEKEDALLMVVDIVHPELREEQRNMGFNAVWRSTFLDF